MNRKGDLLQANKLFSGFFIALMIISYQTSGQALKPAGSDLIQEADPKIALLEKLENGDKLSNSEVRIAFGYLPGHFTSHDILDFDMPAESPDIQLFVCPRLPHGDLRSEIDEIREEMHILVRELKREIEKSLEQIKTINEERVNYSYLRYNELLSRRVQP